MSLNPNTLLTINLDGPTTPLSNDARVKIASFAARQPNIMGVLMQIVTLSGG